MLEIPIKKSVLPRKKYLLVMIFIVICTFLASYKLLKSSESASIDNISIGTVRAGDVTEEIYAYGRLVTSRQTQIISVVDGIVEEVMVFPSNTVEAGDIMLKLVNHELQNAKENAEFNLKKAEAEHKSALSDVLRERVQLENAVELAKLNERLNRLEYEMQLELKKNSLTSQIELVRVQSNFDKSEHEVKTAIRNKDIFEEILSAKKQFIDMNFSSAQRELKIINQDISNLLITTSNSGLLSQFDKDIKPGLPIKRGQLLAVVTDPDSFYAELFVTVSDANKVKVGQPGVIHIGESKISSTVQRIHPTVENNQIQVDLKALEALPYSSRENLDITAIIKVGATSNTIFVEKPTYVNTSHAKQKVYVLEDGIFKAKDVQVGIIGTTKIQIKSGLKLKDKVLLSVPAEFLNRDEIEPNEVIK